MRYTIIPASHQPPLFLTINCAQYRFSAGPLWTLSTVRSPEPNGMPPPTVSLPLPSPKSSTTWQKSRQPGAQAPARLPPHQAVPRPHPPRAPSAMRASPSRAPPPSATSSAIPPRLTASTPTGASTSGRWGGRRRQERARDLFPNSARASRIPHRCPSRRSMSSSSRGRMTCCIHRIGQ